MPTTTSTGGVTPFALPWPRATRRTLLRLLTLDDVDDMHAYRRLPEVCRFLTHDPLGRPEVEERIRRRLPENQPTGGPILCGAAVELDGRMIGDVMMRLDPVGEQLWIGYGFHPAIWGRGLATEVAAALVDVGRELDVPVWADSYVENTASQRVLERVGLVPHHVVAEEGHPRVVFTAPPADTPAWTDLS